MDSSKWRCVVVADNSPWVNTNKLIYWPVLGEQSFSHQVFFKFKLLGFTIAGHTLNNRWEVISDTGTSFMGAPYYIVAEIARHLHATVSLHNSIFHYFLPLTYCTSWAPSIYKIHIPSFNACYETVGRRIAGRLYSSPIIIGGISLDHFNCGMHTCVIWERLGRHAIKSLHSVNGVTPAGLPRT